MSAGSVNDLFQHALDYLDACTAALALTPGGVPPVRYVSPGPPTLECDQLTVHVGGPYIAGTTPPGGALGADHRYAIAEVEMTRMTAIVMRCCAVGDNDGNPPAPSEIQHDAAVTMADVWAIWGYVQDQVRAGLLFNLPQPTGEFSFDPAVAIATQGGVCGWQIPMHVMIPGFHP